MPANRRVRSAAEVNLTPSAGENQQMNFEELEQAVDAAMGQALTNAGFHRVSAGLWNRRRGDELNVIQLQDHSSEPTFSVNLGMHYAFLPRTGTESPLDGDQLEAPDCELKFRLTDRDAVNDQWWPISVTSVGQVAALIDSRVLPVFDSYRLDGPIAALEGKCVENGNAAPLASMTKVRACLLLARMYEHSGHRDKSIEAATIGIKLAGMAVGPKKALKEILKRLGPPA
jgi:hypothetical protein